MEVDFEVLLQRSRGNLFWQKYLDLAANPISGIGIHVAIFSEPYLSYVLDGHKTIESRFSKNRCAPFGGISSGDIILIKEVAGPICGLALAKQVWFYNLQLDSLDAIRDKFADRICGDAAFWEARRESTYVTLIALDEIAAIEPVKYNKQDRRGWVPLRPRQMALPY